MEKCEMGVNVPNSMHPLDPYFLVGDVSAFVDCLTSIKMYFQYMTYS
jgi:hypothetical protein